MAAQALLIACFSHAGQNYADGEIVELGVVLTIAGTGSEFDGGGVITNTETNIKTGRIYPEISPDFSLLDPDYTLTVPERQVRATAFDTMRHLMEFYFCKPDTDNVSDDLLEALLRAQIRNFRTSMRDLKDYGARSHIEWISSLALCGIMGLGKQPDFDCHNLEHKFGAFTDCVHGEGLAVITPSCYRWLMPHAVDRFVRFDVNVWGLAPQGDDRALAAAGVEALAGFIRSVGLPTTLQQLGVKDMAPNSGKSPSQCRRAQALTASAHRLTWKPFSGPAGSRGVLCPYFRPGLRGNANRVRCR